MKHDLRLLRIWNDVIGLVVPLVAMAAYLLDWSSAVRTVLMTTFFVGMFSTWLLTEDLPRWRAKQITRLRRLGRIRRAAQARARRRR
jgi:hypothetical protein